MVDDDRQKIKKLRLKGMGYKGIATLLGLSRDSVRGFCRRNSLDGDSCVVAINYDEKIMKNVLCACCGKILKQKEQGRSKKFCSEKCRRKWWKEHKDERKGRETAIYKFTCLYCNKEFSSYGNKKRKYCSHNCYIKARFWSEEEEI